MAEILSIIPTNLTEYPNSFKRQGAFPLEAYSVFQKVEDAEEYASSNPIAYVGQELIVLNDELGPKLYIIKNGLGELDPIASSVEVDTLKYYTDTEIRKINISLLDKLDLKAPIESPSLTGSPTAPTLSSLTDKASKRIATVEFVHKVIDDITFIEIDGGGAADADPESFEVV